MKIILLMLIVFMQVPSFGQELSLAEKILAGAENSFAGLSRSTNTRNAFLAYLTDSTVMFDNEGPVIGRKRWLDGKPDSSLLFWWPVFIGLSKDGSIGFSTGPWEWSKSRSENEPQAFGYYATIWKKDKQGNWKMGVDLGISFPGSQRTNPSIKASSSHTAAADKTFTKTGLLAIDNAYNVKLDKTSFLEDYYTKDAYLLRDGYAPFAGLANFRKLNENNSYFLFKSIGSGLAGSQDLGYTYGAVSIETTKDGKKETATRGFMRVWKKVNNEWKIVLDVINRG